MPFNWQLLEIFLPKKELQMGSEAEVDSVLYTPCVVERFPLKHKCNYVVKLVLAVLSTVEQIISSIKTAVSCPWKCCVLLCFSSSSIMRLCLQSDAVISCAWTCLYVPHCQQKGPFRHTTLWCFNTLPPRKHHSGIFPLC